MYFFLYCCLLVASVSIYNCDGETVESQAVDFQTKTRYKVATMAFTPFAYLKDDSFEGFMPSLLQLIFKDLIDNVTFDYYEPADKKFGSTDATGVWSGLIGEVVAGRADIAAAPLTITTQRARVVRFSFPFMTANIVPMMQRPSRPGAKVPFRNLKEMTEKAAEGKITYGVIRSGSTQKMLQESTYALYSEMYAQMMRKQEAGDDPFVQNYNEAVERIRNDSSYVFLGEDTALEYMASRRPCDLIIWGHKRPLNTAFYGLAFPVDFPDAILERINLQLIKLQSTGQVRFLMDKWYDSDCSKPKLCLCRDPDDDHEHHGHQEHQLKQKGRHGHHHHHGHGNTTNSEESNESIEKHN